MKIPISWIWGSYCICLKKTLWEPAFTPIWRTSCEPVSCYHINLVLYFVNTPLRKETRQIWLSLSFEKGKTMSYYANSKGIISTIYKIQNTSPLYLFEGWDFNRSKWDKDWSAIWKVKYIRLVLAAAKEVNIKLIHWWYFTPGKLLQISHIGKGIYFIHDGLAQYLVTYMWKIQCKISQMPQSLSH